MTNPAASKTSAYVFVVVLLGLLCLTYFLVRPFLSSIVWAAVLVTLFFPVARRLRVLLHNRDTLTAVLMSALVVVIIILPVVALAFVLTREAIHTYHLIEDWASRGGLDSLSSIQDSPQVQSVLTEVRRFVDVGEVDLKANILSSVRQLTAHIGARTSSLVQGFTSSLLSFVFMVFSMFFFFRDGPKLVDGLTELSPLAPDALAEGVKQFVEVSKATLYGGVVVALVQGFLGGVGFAILGIPSAVLWGAVMAFLSMIPMVGPAFVWVPTAVILAASGAWVKGLILVAWGVLVVGLSDNFLRPILIGGRTGLPTILVFFGVLGGLRMFGFLGLVLGPVLMAVLISFIRIYRNLYGPNASAKTKVPSYPDA